MGRRLPRSAPHQQGVSARLNVSLGPTELGDFAGKLT